MIDTIWREAHVKASDLPSFCYLIGECGAHIPVRVRFGARSGTVILIPIDGLKRGVVYAADRVFHVLIPEDFDSARMDIELDLILRGGL